MEYMAIIIVSAAALFFVSYPLFGRQRRLYDIESAFESREVVKLNYLGIMRTRIEENLRELEFEYQMGKLSEQDYAALREGYEKEIENVDKSLDSFRIKQDVEELIENEVRARRRTK